jgi:hypothetical protein
MSKFEDLMPTDDQLDSMMEESGVFEFESRLSVLRKMKTSNASAANTGDRVVPDKGNNKITPVLSTVASQIPKALVPRDLLSEASWLQSDPFEFSDLYCEKA